ncbi:hypothetical protein ABZU76_19700 [Amycolatopsis sp. NPDC005232]|uniref:hypothetical protein n=1 Tax=Amycolatopsis sp. NPDC005232 TaxID=3157027 RepID=UPI0033B46D7C
MSRRAGVLAAIIAAAGVLAAGCTADDEPSTMPPATFTSVPAPATTGGPFASPSPSSTLNAPAGDQTYVKRGAQTGVPNVDVLITLDWAKGKINPPAGTVDVQVGNRVRVVLTSDQQVDVNVDGHPEAATAVGPGDSANVDWAVTQPGATAVTLGADKTLLTTVRAS